MARSIETHYDNLKVVRDAPVEVIKASYRALSQKYHPDRNPDPDALRSMQVINQAWDVLSDPERRATHDRWIATHEGDISDAPAGPRRWPHQYAPHVAAALGVLLIAFVALQFVNAHSTDSAALAAAPVTSRPEAKPDALAAVRQSDGYISSEVQYFSAGLSSIDIDNTGTSADVEIRLERNGRMARSMIVRQGKAFLVGQLPPGTYTMKYKVTEADKVRVYQANATFQIDQSVEETDEGRRDKFSELQVSMANLAGGKHEIALDDF
ncbi:MAG: J domain-containing protein [Pseudomonadota bacterium]